MTNDAVQPGESGESVKGSANPHQVESLDDLAEEGKRLDSGAAPSAPGTPPAEVDQPATLEDIVDLLSASREMAAPALEDAGVLKGDQLRAIWTDDALRRIAKPLLSIMRRHNLNVEGAFDKWGPYIMLLAGMVGPGWATFRAVRENMAKPADATA